MQIDCDYYTAQASEMPRKSYMIFTANTFHLDYLPGLVKTDEYAVLRMYGVTDAGNSVMAHIHNFLSYFYVEVVNEKQSYEFKKGDYD